MSFLWILLTQLLQIKKNWGHTKKRHFPYGGRESGKTWLLIIPGSVIIVTILSIQILEQNKLGIFLICTYVLLCKSQKLTFWDFKGKTRAISFIFWYGKKTVSSLSIVVRRIMKPDRTLKRPVHVLTEQFYLSNLLVRFTSTFYS